MAAWNKLARSDQLEIAEMILGHGSIDTGGTWASTWLNTRAWELPAAPAIVADEPIAEDMQSVFREQGRKSSGPAMLSPYSPEWQAERARRVARHEPTHLMDDWAKRGISWPCV
jgi:hypothetical protein